VCVSKETHGNENEQEIKKKLETFSSHMFDEALDKAATKIQCTYRGFKTRKSLKSSLKKRIEIEVDRKESDVGSTNVVEVVSDVAESVTEISQEPIVESTLKRKSNLLKRVESELEKTSPLESVEQRSVANELNRVNDAVLEVSPETVIEAPGEELLSTILQPEPEPVVETLLPAQVNPEPIVESTEVVEQVINDVLLSTILQPEPKPVVETLLPAQVNPEPEPVVETLLPAQVNPEPEPVVETLLPAQVNPEPEPVVETLLPAQVNPEPETVVETLLPAQVNPEPEPVVETLLPAQVNPEPEPVINNVLLSTILQSEPEPVLLDNETALESEDVTIEQILDALDPKSVAIADESAPKRNSKKKKNRKKNSPKVSETETIPNSEEQTIPVSVPLDFDPEIEASVKIQTTNKVNITRQEPFEAPDQE